MQNLWRAGYSDHRAGRGLASAEDGAVGVHAGQRALVREDRARRAVGGHFDVLFDRRPAVARHREPRASARRACNLRRHHKRLSDADVSRRPDALHDQRPIGRRGVRGNGIDGNARGGRAGDLARGVARGRAAIGHQHDAPCAFVRQAKTCCPERGLEVSARG